MIISQSCKFVLIRIPKAASTSAAIMVYDSGILDKTRDITCGIENGITSEYPEDTARPPINFNFTWDKMPIDPERPRPPRHFNRVRHATYDSLHMKNLVRDNYTCYSTIRHPVDRFISISYFTAKYGKNQPIENPEIINEIWDKFYQGDTVFDEANYMFKIPQYTYLNKNPVCWNTENLHEHLLEFVQKYNGNVNILQNAKYNKDRVRNWDECLTLDRQQQLLEMYQQDFLLWETSYRKFN